MVLATSRDAFSPRWHVAGYTTFLRLERLSGADSRRLIQTIAGDRLAPDVQAGIAVRAEGVPLYLEELTLALLEAGGPRGLGEVPTSLHALLAARLDKMADAKPLLQVGAVLGRQFASPTSRRSRPAARRTSAPWSPSRSRRGLLDRPNRETSRSSPSSMPSFRTRPTPACSTARSGVCTPPRSLTSSRRRVVDRRWRGLARVPRRTRRGLGQGRALPHRIPVAGESQSANHEAVALYDRTLNVVERLPADVSADPGNRCASARVQPIAGAGRNRPPGQRHAQADSLADAWVTSAGWRR